MCQSTNNTNTNTTTKRKVSFSTINIIELPMILGDHPACSDNFPVQTSWDVSARYEFMINDYERVRETKRRPSSDLYLSSLERSIL